MDLRAVEMNKSQTFFFLGFLLAKPSKRHGRPVPELDGVIFAGVLSHFLLAARIRTKIQQPCRDPPWRGVASKILNNCRSNNEKKKS